MVNDKTVSLDVGRPAPQGAAGHIYPRAFAVPACPRPNGRRSRVLKVITSVSLIERLKVARWERTGARLVVLHGSALRRENPEIWT